MSLASGLVYILILGEPGSAFYLFAGLAFLGGPLAAGALAAVNSREHQPKAFLAAGSAVFGIVFGLFLLTYMVLPQFERANVELPSFCDGFDGNFQPPAQLAYNLPGIGAGILIISDEKNEVVARVNSNQPPFPTTVWIVDATSHKILLSMPFKNDVVSAAIGEGVIYVFNDKIGFLIDAPSGEIAENFLVMDNYGGLSPSDRPVISRASSGHWYLETSAVISSWNVNGAVVSRPHLTFNGIALGCFISGSTREVIKY